VNVERFRRDRSVRGVIDADRLHHHVAVTALAFDDLYRSQRGPLCRAVALTVGDLDLAKEAVDEAFARAYQRWARVGTLDNPGGWVYRVAVNWSRSALRRRRRQPPQWLLTPHSTESTPEDPSIAAALATLSTDQRAVVVCRLLMGLSEQQTAHALGIRAGTAKSRLARALQHLRPLLADHHRSTD
jgi:RNA polymerase sigma factor (sigma-70 family)